MNNTISVDQLAECQNTSGFQMRKYINDCGFDGSSEMISMRDALAVISYMNSVNARERNSQEYLAAMIQRCTPYIDTCELLHEQFPTLMENMTPLLKQNGKKLMITSGVEAELKNLFIKKPELQKQIAAVFKLLEQKEKEGVVSVCGQEGVTFADQQLLSIATGSLLSDEALFITNDTALSEDILKLNTLGSIRGKKVIVNRISKYGYLAKYTPIADRQPSRCSDMTHTKLSN